MTRLMAGASINNLMQGLSVRSSLPTATRLPIQLDRYHNSGHGDWQQSAWGGSGGGGHYHSGGSGGKKSSVALTALTLLAFLFFLNILQNCIQDQYYDMNGGYGGTPTTMVMMTAVPARRYRPVRVGRSVADSFQMVEGNTTTSTVQAMQDQTFFGDRSERFYRLLSAGLERLRVRHLLRGNSTEPRGPMRRDEFQYVTTTRPETSIGTIATWHDIESKIHIASTVPSS